MIRNAQSKKATGEQMLVPKAKNKSKSRIVKITIRDTNNED